jgi:hypothetical protein
MNETAPSPAPTHIKKAKRNQMKLVPFSCEIDLTHSVNDQVAAQRIAMTKNIRKRAPPPFENLAARGIFGV